MADSGLGIGEIHFFDAIETPKNDTSGDKTLEVWYDIILHDDQTSGSTIALQHGESVVTHADGGLQIGLDDYHRNLTTIKLALKVSKM
eukprot:UN05715